MSHSKNQYEAVDFIFSIIKIHEKITLSFLLKNFDTELKFYKIDKSTLDRIVKYLVDDKKIYDDNGAYRIDPAAIRFIGYFKQSLELEKTSKKKNLWKSILKIVPIFLVFFFGCTTLYYNCKNTDIREELKKKDKIIDSLTPPLKLEKKLLKTK